MDGDDDDLMRELAALHKQFDDLVRLIKLTTERTFEAAVARKSVPSRPACSKSLRPFRFHGSLVSAPQNFVDADARLKGSRGNRLFGDEWKARIGSRENLSRPKIEQNHVFGLTACNTTRLIVA